MLETRFFIPIGHPVHGRDDSFASNCLLARRLAERGARFIQLYHRDWDHHSGVTSNVAIKAQEVD